MNRLKELRKERSLSQKALSKETGVPLRTLQSWENGESQIRTANAQRLADYFGVSVGYLLGYELPTDDEKTTEPDNKISRMADEMGRLAKEIVEKILRGKAVKADLIMPYELGTVRVEIFKITGE